MINAREIAAATTPCRPGYSIVVKTTVLCQQLGDSVVVKTTAGYRTCVNQRRFCVSSWVIQLSSKRRFCVSSWVIQLSSKQRLGIEFVSTSDGHPRYRASVNQRRFCVSSWVVQLSSKRRLGIEFASTSDSCFAQRHTAGCATPTRRRVGLGFGIVVTQLQRVDFDCGRLYRSSRFIIVELRSKPWVPSYRQMARFVEEEHGEKSHGHTWTWACTCPTQNQLRGLSHLLRRSTRHAPRPRLRCIPVGGGSRRPSRDHGRGVQRSVIPGAPCFLNVSIRNTSRSFARETKTYLRCISSSASSPPPSMIF